MTEKFIVGLIGAPFGVKGLVKVRPCSGEIDHLLKLQSVTVNKDGKEKLLVIEEITPVFTGNKSSGVLVRFEGIDNPEAAKSLNGAQLIVNREQASPLYDDEFYIEDLKGLPVFSHGGTEGGHEGAEGSILGNVVDIIEGGGGDLLEIKLINGEKRLIPFRKEFFPEISPEKGRILLQNLWILE